MDPLRVGVIGAGQQGERRARALEEIPQLRLVGFYDTDSRRAGVLAAELDCRAYDRYDELVEDSDLVVVATPPVCHYSEALFALDKGRHVLCEKPLCVRGSDAAHVAAVAHGGGQLLRTGFHLRHYPGVQELRHLIASGYIGEVERVFMLYGSARPKGFERTWRVDPEVAGGGELVDQGIHLLDMAAHFFSHCHIDVLEVKLVNSETLTDRVEDTAFILLKVRGGPLVNLTASWMLWDARFEVRVFGSRGHLELTGLGGRYGPQVLGGSGYFRIEYPEVDVWRAEWLDILDELDGRPFTGGDGEQANELLDAARGLASAGP